MQIYIKTTGFNLRKDTESLLFTSGAEQFMKDNNILYEVINHDYSNTMGDGFKDEARIHIHEDDSLVTDNTIDTIEGVFALANKYNADLTFSGFSRVTIEFK